MPGHMTSTKNSQGLPMAMRNDCRLPESSGGTEARFEVEDIGGAPGGRVAGVPGPPITRLVLARLASVSLPLPADLPPLSRSFLLLLPDALLPAQGRKKSINVKTWHDSRSY